jgi:hypothetical protein
MMSVDHIRFRRETCFMPRYALAGFGLPRGIAPGSAE